MHNQSELPEGMTRSSDESERNFFRAEDCNDPRSYIEGRLISGTLSFTVVAEIQGNRDSFAGRQFFDAMMAYFGTR